MPRRSKKAEEELEVVEPVAEEAAEETPEENVEPEAEEATLAAAEESASKTQELAIPEKEEETKTQEKKPRRRRRRSPKKEVAAAVEESELAVELPAGDDITIGAATMQKSMESVAKQWIVIREVSQNVTTHLERVNQLIQEIPQGAVFHPVQKANPLTRIAIGASGLAIVLSLVSISMSQSVRTSVFAQGGIPVETVNPSTQRSNFSFLPEGRVAPENRRHGVSASDLGRGRSTKRR